MRVRIQLRILHIHLLPLLMAIDPLNIKLTYCGVLDVILRPYYSDFSFIAAD